MQPRARRAGGRAGKNASPKTKSGADAVKPGAIRFDKVDRNAIAAMIGKGKTDDEIFEQYGGKYGKKSIYNLRYTLRKVINKVD